MATKPLPPRDLLRQLLRYDADTGDLIWLPRPREMFKSSSQFLNWNGRYPGTIAGYVRPTGNRGPGYLHIGIGGIIYVAHRLVWLYVIGEPVPDMIDHKDHDRLNNRIDNLRAATMPQNRANSFVRKDSLSGLKGIRQTKFNRFLVHCGGRYQGTFKTIEEAMKAYKQAAALLYGEFARWDQR